MNHPISESPVVTGPAVFVYDQRRHAHYLKSSCSVQPGLAWVKVSILIHEEICGLYTSADKKELWFLIEEFKLPLATLWPIPVDGTTNKRNVSNMPAVVTSVVLRVCPSHGQSLFRSQTSTRSIRGAPLAWPGSVRNGRVGIWPSSIVTGKEKALQVFVVQFLVAVAWSIFEYGRAFTIP